MNHGTKVVPGMCISLQSFATWEGVPGEALWTYWYPQQQHHKINGLDLTQPKLCSEEHLQTDGAQWYNIGFSRRSCKVLHTGKHVRARTVWAGAKEVEFME